MDMNFYQTRFSARRYGIINLSRVDSFPILLCLFWWLTLPLSTLGDLRQSQRIDVLTHELQTGTIFNDKSGWGEFSGVIMLGEDFELNPKQGWGWIRFDTSSIPDTAIILSAKCTFVVGDAHPTRNIQKPVEFVGLAEDPETVTPYTRWYDLNYGELYLSDSVLYAGTWEFTLGESGRKKLQNFLKHNWYALGIRTTSNSADTLFIGGWDSQVIPYLLVDYILPERIASAEWSPTKPIEEGGKVAMLVKVEGLQPDEKVKFEVWENDLLGDDLVDTDKISKEKLFTQSGQQYIQAEWQPEWQLDIYKLPEFYFRVTLNNQSLRSEISKSKLLRVIKGPDVEPPQNDPISFLKLPYLLAANTIKMEAQKVVDNRHDVEYKFLCVVNGGGGKNSDWIKESYYLDQDLQYNSRYGYKVIARDTSNNRNQVQPSKPAYLYTLADIPAMPMIKTHGKTSLTVELRPDKNPLTTEYCIYNFTTQNFINLQGRTSNKIPIWHTRHEWENLVLVDLFPGTFYTFAIKARNYDGVETDWSQRNGAITLMNSPDLYCQNQMISISQKDWRHKFSDWYITIVNHPTAGILENSWKLEWILSKNRIIGDDDDRIIDTWTMKDSFTPGQSKTYYYDRKLSPTIDLPGYKFAGVRIADVPNETNVDNNTTQ